MDSTDIHAYSNGGKRRSSDPDASWSAKRGKSGKTLFWFGFKGHLMADATHEIPIWFHTTTAKRNDGHEILPLLQEARDRLPRFRPECVLADAGYDHKKVYKEIVEDFQATPIIKMNMHGKKPDEIWDELTTYDGTPFAPCGTPMVFGRYSPNRRAVEFRCPQATDEAPPCSYYHGHFGCTPDKPYSIWLDITKDYRRLCAIPRSSKNWSKLYNRRVSVERAFSRLKEFRKLNNSHVRGLPKIELHCCLAILVMQAMALGKVKTEGIQEARNNVKKVA